jgi:hypothetical protein
MSRQGSPVRYSGLVTAVPRLTDKLIEAALGFYNQQDEFESGSRIPIQGNHPEKQEVDAESHIEAAHLHYM